MVYDFLSYCCEDTGLQSSLLSITMNMPINYSAGTNFLLSQVSEKYWVIAAHGEIREWEGECSMCKQRRNKSSTQIMDAS